MKIFISSVISGFEEFREAAARAIDVLGYDVIRAEDFGASASTPQQACLAGVREADLTVLILGSRYGAKQPSGLSATHEEYREAREHNRVLAFVQEGIGHEEDQAAFIQEVRSWDTGSLTVSFETEDELQNAVTRALHDAAVTEASHTVDERELLGHAEQILTALDSNHMGPQLVLGLVPGPRQEILRPSELEDEAFAREFQQQALFGPQPLLAVEAGTRTDLRAGWLILSQESSSVALNSAGDLLIRSPAIDRLDYSTIPALIEEDIEMQVGSALRFAVDQLERVDPVHRLSHVAIVAALVGLSYEPWRTRSEQVHRPHFATLGGGRNCASASLTPGVRSRAEVHQRNHELARDLTVLLRRQVMVEVWQP